MKAILLAISLVPFVAGLGFQNPNEMQINAGQQQQGSEIENARGSDVPMPGAFYKPKMDMLSSEQRSMFNRAAEKAMELMNKVYLPLKNPNGVGNAMPLRYTEIVSASTQVIAGTNYDLVLSVVIDGQTETCHVLVTNLYPWNNGGIWSISADKPSDPCAPYIPKPENSRRKRSAHLLGGMEDADVNDAAVQEAAQWALEHINERSNSMYRQGLQEIAHVTRQVVNGYRYRFLLSVVTTTCRNQPENRGKSLGECPANENPKPQECDVSVINSQGQFSMESFKCKAKKARKILGGDDHDYKPHGKILGGDDHDYKPHGKILGGDDHDYKPHGKILGGDDHDYKPHGKILGGDDHDYKPHGTPNFIPDGKVHLIGGDTHDYKPHGERNPNLLGKDLHDYIPHVNKLGGLMGGQVNNLKKDFVTLGSGIFKAGGDSVKHMSILGGDGHDYLPHGDNDKCAKLRPEFEDFKGRFNKVYGSSEEEAQRFRVFCANMARVDQIRQVEQGSAVYGATKFADISEEEFKKQYLGLKPSLSKGPKLSQAKIPVGDVPDSWDWRDHGAVTPVKNQGSCGSCWAFSTTGNIEGQWAINSPDHKLYSLSEQELVDCDKIDEGCNGGLPTNAYEAIMKLGGIETEDDYEYEGYNEKCKFDKSEVVVKLKGAVNISQDEGEIAAWLAKNGPISIGINAFAMQFYMGGIAHPWRIFCNPSSLDHGVLIVGYGKEGSEPYWIVKNSWGADWGREGYYYVYRGDGTCGLNTMCTSSVVV